MQAFLVYENTNGDVSIISNSNLWSSNILLGGSAWEDISEPLYNAYSSGKPMASIATAASPAGSDSLNIVLVVDFSSIDPVKPGAYFWSPSYNLTTAAWQAEALPGSVRSTYVPGDVDRGNFDICQVTVFNDSNSIPYFYTIYINGTTLRLFSGGTPDGVEESVPPVIRPPSMFPFTHFASTILSNSTVVYLYHQLNNTAFAEDKYDTVGSFWTSSTIGLSLV